MILGLIGLLTVLDHQQVTARYDQPRQRSDRLLLQRVRVEVDETAVGKNNVKRALWDRWLENVADAEKQAFVADAAFGFDCIGGADHLIDVINAEKGTVGMSFEQTEAVLTVAAAGLEDAQMTSLS